MSRGRLVPTVLCALQLTLPLICTACLRKGNSLVWEGEGAPRDRSVDAISEGFPPGQGPSSVPWGASRDASFLLLRSEVAERPHVHDRHDLTIVVLAGSGVLQVEDRRYRLEGGDVVHIGRGRTHHFHPHGAVVGLAVFTPLLESPDTREIAEPATR